MFQVIDQNGDTLTVYSARSYTITSDVDTRIITEFLLFDQFYKAWSWESSDSFIPLSQGSK